MSFEHKSEYHRLLKQSLYVLPILVLRMVVGHSNTVNGNGRTNSLKLCDLY